MGAAETAFAPRRAVQVNDDASKIRYRNAPRLENVRNGLRLNRVRRAKYVQRANARRQVKIAATAAERDPHRAWMNSVTKPADVKRVDV